MRLKNILIICSCALLLSGCTKSNIVNSGEPMVPEMETKEGIELEWGQIGDDLDEQFINSDDYPMAVSVNYSVEPDKNFMDITLMVAENTTPEEAVTFATDVIKAINDEAAIQDFSYEQSSETSYGGFSKVYSMSIAVLPDGMMENKDSWLVEMDIPAGSDTPIIAKQ